jgi:hypothetical protein
MVVLMFKQLCREEKSLSVGSGSNGGGGGVLCINTVTKHPQTAQKMYLVLNLW